ncbi:unnamed protein product [Symbiodinium necroappetens]|uniref:Flagellar basal body-associated FliL family protein n=1 Tax=Symbiodinium necroappetens TaxID=1628268 RepID=A0A813B033_9DINO|nr:unnamed protein product [Symbiodinium necroappetens]
MKRLVILLVLLVLLGGGGFAAWTYGMPIYEKMQAEKAAQKPEPVYVSLTPLVVPVIENNRVTHHLTLAISVEVAGASGDAKLREAMPRVIDAFTTELYGLMSLEFVREGGVELPLVKQRLILVGERELGPEVVTDVLIEAVDRIKGQRDLQS